ncbi:MAG: hypothetical protein H6668_06125 [Ardenticatenaceae bacterium]|nr:hypothetical protein [Ardenticatenaceae bacterium]
MTLDYGENGRQADPAKLLTRWAVAGRSGVGHSPDCQRKQHGKRGFASMRWSGVKHPRCFPLFAL